MQLQQEPPEGIKIFLNEEDVTNIEASIEGPGKYSVFLTSVNFKALVAGTPYEGGIFKMKLVLAKDFPASPPQGRY